MAYGKDYPFEVGCGKCGTTFDYMVDLTKLPTIEPSELPVNGEYTTVLPTGMEITFKLLTRAEEKAVAAEVEAVRKIDIAVGDGSVRLKHMITSFGGNRDKKAVREFADAMIIRDVRAVREAFKKVSPGVNFDLSIPCSACENVIKARMPFGANFFWPEVG